MDLRFRLLLRQYLANPTPENAEITLIAAIRHGIIPVEQEPAKALFSDMAVGYGDWDEMSGASQEYIRAHDTSSGMFRKNYLIIIDQSLNSDTRTSKFWFIFNKQIDDRVIIELRHVYVYFTNLEFMAYFCA